MPPSSSARIVLCGALTAQIEGRDVTRALPAGRGVLLFAYLVGNRGRPVTRDELIDVLWPDRRPENPDAALSTLLTRLRRALGGALARGSTRLQLELGPEPWIDVEIANARARAAEIAA